MNNDFKNKNKKYTFPMVQPIFFERIKPIKPIKDISSIENSINFNFNFDVIKVKERIDNVLINKLYEIYKNTDIDELIVINEEQFKKFLLNYIPVYIKNDGNEVLEDDNS